MELPYEKHREKYIKLVQEFEEELHSQTNGSNVSELGLHSLQEKLDAIAAQYQHDEKIGTARYKLYELQAYLHYYEYREDKALDFINQAIDMRGGNYKTADELKSLLANKSTTQSSDSTEVETKKKKLIGLEGWLAWFIVGQILALIITIFRFFSDGFLSTTDIDTLNAYQPGLGDTFQTLTGFENVMVIVYAGLVVTTLVLLFRRRKLAKLFAIGTLAFAAIYGVVDYAIASSTFNSSGLSQSAEMQSFMSQYASSVGRSIIAALIWIPYFVVSKRVKATLIRD